MAYISDKNRKKQLNSLNKTAIFKKVWISSTIVLTIVWMIFAVLGAILPTVSGVIDKNYEWMNWIIINEDKKEATITSFGTTMIVTVIILFIMLFISFILVFIFKSSKNVYKSTLKLATTARSGEGKKPSASSTTRKRLS